MTIINGMGGVTGLRYGARYTPVPNITPFTYRDGWTFLERLEHFIKWVNEGIVPQFNELKEYVDTETGEAIDLFNQTLQEKIDEINALLAAHDDAVEDVLQQVINNSIEMQDAVLAGIIRDDPESESRTELDNLYVGPNSGIYQLDALAPNGLIEDRIMAAVDAVPSDSTIVVPVGSYDIVKSIQIDDLDKNVSIEATGCVFTRTSDHHFINVNGIWSAPASVTGMTVIDNNGTKATEVILGSAVPAMEGDIVKLYSDDPIQDVRQPNTTRFQGEMVEVLRTTPTGLVLQGELFDTYSTNVRVSAMVPASFSWRGGLFKGGTSRGAIVRYNSLYRPYLSMDVEGSGTIGFTMRSCYHPTVENCTVSDLMNDTSTEPYRLGYAVHDSGSRGLMFRNSDVYRSRHAYTDDVSNAVGSDPASFGRPMYAVIENVRAYGMKTGSFSPHHGGVGHRFINSLSENGQGTGFSMRGINHSVESCIVVGGSASFTSFVEGGGSTYGCRFIDCCAYNGTSGGFVDQAELDRVPTDSYGMSIVNGFVQGAPRALTSIRTRTRVDGLRYVSPAQLDNDSTAIVSADGIIDSSGTIDIDYRGNVSGEALAVATISGDSARLRAERVRLRNFGMSTRLRDVYKAGSGSAGTARFNVDETVVDEWPDVLHRSLSPDTIAPFRTAQFTRFSNTIERTDIGITNIATPTYSPDDTVVVCTMTANVPRVLGNPLPGLYVGQKITVICHQTGTATTAGVDIQNAGLIHTIDGLTWRLLNNQMAEFVWNGDSWVMTVCTGASS